MKYLVVILAVLVIGLGIAGFVYGEADDSPGLQLIGVVLIVGALALGVRTVKPADSTYCADAQRVRKVILPSRATARRVYSMLPALSRLT